MDLLILNICEPSVTTFLAHSWKDWQDCLNRAELDRGFPLEHWLDCLWNLLDLRRCCWFLWLKLGTVMPREARGVLPGAANGSLSAFVLKGLSSILPASTAFWQCHTVFLLRFSQIVLFSSSSCVLISDRLPARVAQCGVSNHVSHRGVTKEFTWNDAGLHWKGLMCLITTL